MLDPPDRLAAAVAAMHRGRIGDQELWTERIGQVSASGTPGS